MHARLLALLHPHISPQVPCRLQLPRSPGVDASGPPPCNLEAFHPTVVPDLTHLSPSGVFLMGSLSPVRLASSSTRPCGGGGA